MFDTKHTRRVAEEQEQKHISASISRLTTAQRTALVSLLGGSATFFPRHSGYWVVPCLGQSWAIAQITIDALVKEGLVDVSGRARLTKLGKWYAISSAGREIDERSQLSCYSERPTGRVVD